MSNWKIIEPMAALNYVLEPSFEGALVSWTAGGTNTIARSTDRAWRGLYSGKCTYGNNGSLGVFPLTLVGSTVFYFKGRLWVPNDWDGGDIRLTQNGFASASIQYDAFYDDGVSDKGRWLKLKSTVTLAADAGGDIVLQAVSAPTAGRYVYLDAVHVDTVDGDYVDGEQEGCYWMGTRYASTSVRSGQSRAGGVERDLEGDLYFNVAEKLGSGVPEISHREQMAALLDGAFDRGEDVGPRTLSLPGYVIGTSEANLFERRSDLFDVIKPDRVKGNQPFLLRYVAGDELNEMEVEIRGKYAGGLEVGKGLPFEEETTLRVRCADPYWYGLEEKAAVLTHEQAVTANYCAGWLNGAWAGMDDAGTGRVWAWLFDGNYLYVGFDGLNWAGIATADYIARYNLISGVWESITAAGAANGRVRDLLKHPNGEIYAVGAFTSIGGVAANRIARYNPSTGAWAACSTGLGAEGYTLALYPLLGVVLVGGNFTSPYNYVCVWNPNSGAFVNMNGGTNAAVNDILVVGGDIVIIGNFTTVNGATATPVGYVAVAVNAAMLVVWEALGSSGFNNGGNMLTLAPGGVVYAGGAMTTCDGQTTSYMAKLVGGTRSGTWQAMTEGPDSTVTFVRWSQVFGGLVFGGAFATVGDNNSPGYGLFDGSTFSNLPFVVTTTDAYALLVFAEEATRGDYVVGWHVAPDTFVGAGGVTNISPTGTRKVFPKVVVEVSGTAGQAVRVEWLKNELTGLVIHLRQVVEAGAKLVIDLMPRRKRIVYYVGSEVVEVSGSGMLRDSDFAEWALLPGQANQVYVQAPDYVGTPTVAVYMLWRERYWMLDGIVNG